MGWKHSKEFVSVKPKNLRSEPPGASGDAPNEFKDWIKYVPKELAAANCEPSHLLALGLKYMPLDHPSRREVHDTLKLLLQNKHSDAPAVQESSEEKVRRQLAANVAAMAVADGQVSSDEDEAEQMFQEMERSSEASLQANGFDDLAKCWPTHFQATEFIAIVNERDSKSYTAEVHNLLRQMFESRHDPETVKDAGNILCQMDGFQCMRTAFYNYQKVLLKAGDDHGWPKTRSRDLWQLLKLDVSRGWDGIGGWSH